MTIPSRNGQTCIHFYRKDTKLFCFVKNFNYEKFNCILDNSQAKNKLILILDVQKAQLPTHWADLQCYHDLQL